MSAAGPSSSEAARVHSLTSLITSLPSTSAPAPADSPPAQRKLYPNDDTLVTVLHARSRFELPYTRVGPSGTAYVVVNPLRVLGCLGEEARKGYTEDIEGAEGRGDRDGERQPSVYELAGRVWLLMARRRESQSVIYQ
jgi:chitin synthase